MKKITINIHLNEWHIIPFRQDKWQGYVLSDTVRMYQFLCFTLTINLKDKPF